MLHSLTCSPLTGGGKPISPFGVAKRFKSFRNAINKEYPRLKDDIEGGGMASYIEEVGMDADVITEGRPYYKRFSESIHQNSWKSLTGPETP